MRYSNAFGKNGSKILLGTAYFGETISREESFDIMDKFAALGGTHIDTARLYASGESEKVIAEWIASRKPAEVFVSTKGAFPNKATPDMPRVSEKEVRYDLELSLRALNTECVNFYWLHRDDESRDVGEIIEFMNAFVREGKILHFGASNWKHERIEEANQYANAHGLLGFEASQIRFSPAIVSPTGTADRKLVDMSPVSFDYYRERKMPVAAYASQAKGFFSKMAAFGESGLSEKSKDRYMCPENLETLEAVKALAEEYGCSIAAIVCGALASLSSPDVFPIIGGSNALQIEDSLRGADVVLTKAELENIFKGYRIGEEE